MKVAFENTKIKGYLEYVLENIKDDNVGICFDAGHYHVHFDDELCNGKKNLNIAKPLSGEPDGFRKIHALAVLKGHDEISWTFVAQ